MDGHRAPNGGGPQGSQGGYPQGFQGGYPQDFQGGYPRGFQGGYQGGYLSKTIKGDFPAELASQEGYDALLQRAKLQYLRNPAGNAIYEFAALVDGMAYTAS